MKAVEASFRQMLIFLKNDMMLAAASLAPILMGAAFRFAVPKLELWLTGCFGMERILEPYYPLLDLFLTCITPVFYCFIAAMVMLEERDDHITSALYASPLGKSGYFLSRLGLPGAAAFLGTICVQFVFSLTSFSFFGRIFLALNGALQGILLALLIVILSSNKLEGMAVTKLSSLILLGSAVPWFVPEKAQYVFWLLPSFWMGKAVRKEQLFFLLLSLVLLIIWISILLRSPKMAVKYR